MNLTIIIVNYNVKYFLEQCLYSVVKACSRIDAEIFVVDNNSNDGSREYLEEKFPQVIFKWQQENNGFAKANNSVLAEATGEYILFLNPDTIVPEDCFQSCLAYLKMNSKAAALGVRMLDGAGRFLKESKRSFPSPKTSFFKMAGFARLFPSSKLFARYYLGHLSEYQNHEVDVLAGAFMMVRKKCLDEVKGFDEGYFMYGEDIDLSYRLQKAGYKNYYYSGTSILHFKGESTQKATYNYVRTFYGAMQLFVSKHYKEKKLTYFIMHTAIVLSRFLAAIKALLRKLFFKNKHTGVTMQTAVVAGQQKFDEVIKLIKYAHYSILIKGRIATDKYDRGYSIGKFEDIHSVVKKYDVNELIFCEGEISFKEIIEKLQQIPPQTGCMFHAQGSDSIVGSNSKNEKGVFISKR